MKNHFNTFVLSPIIMFVMVMPAALLPTVASADAPVDLSNLIINSDFETASADPSLPQGWAKGEQYGVNAISYVYPATNTPASDISSGVAVQISFPSYLGNYNQVPVGPEGGDAKWFFTPVAVSHDRQYAFHDSYISDVETNLVAEYFDASHAHVSFQVLAGSFSIPATPVNTWKAANGIFTTPSNAAYMTVYHVLHSQGTLTIDNTSLTLVPPPSPFVQGFVSLTFDDGFADHSTVVKPALDAAGVKGTFYVVSHLTGFGVKNPGFEDWTGALPTGWVKASSTSAGATFVASTTAHTGVKSAQIHTTATSTIGGLSFVPMTVMADQDYSYGDWYKGSASRVYIKITTATTTFYVNSAGNLVGGRTAFANLGTATNWTHYQTPAISGTNGFYVPVGATAVTVTHGLDAAGTLLVDDVTLDARAAYMVPSQVLGLQSDGQEIGGHSQTHADLTMVADPVTEMSGSRDELLTGGVSTVTSFAYPYGNYNASTESIAQSHGFTSARTVLPGFNGRNSDKFALLSQSVNADTSLAQVKTWIDQAKVEKTWLILTFHQVEPNLSSPDLAYATTPQTLADILSYINAQSIPVRTVTQGIAYLVPDTTAPVITLLGDNPMVIVAGASFTDPGATAVDESDFSVTPTITENTVLSATPGSYHVTYGAQDAAGNHATPATRVVNVVATPDTTAPQLTVSNLTTNDTTPTLTGTTDDIADVSVSVNGKTYVATPASGNWSTTVPNEDLLADGTYPIAVSSTDGASNVGAGNGTLVINTAAPTLTLNVIAPNAVTIGGTTDAGVTLTVTIGGNPVIATVGGDNSWSAPVGTLADGIYPVVVTATNALSNTATANGSLIIDTTIPVITLNGITPTDIHLGDVYIDLGATALDAIDGNLTSAITTVNAVNVSILGTYQVTYNVHDAAGNNAIQVVRTVNVTPASGANQAPVITLLGSNPVDLTVGGTYTDAGATVLDAEDGDITSTKLVVTGSVDVNTVGTYTIHYNAIDAQSLAATEVTRTVNVNAVVVPPPPPAPPSGGGGGGGGGAVYYYTSININGGAAQSSSTNVTLSLAASGLSQMWISNDSGFSSGNWAPLQSSYPWTLTNSTGTKTVYARFGNSSSTYATNQASILLTALNPVIPVPPTGGTVLGTSTTCTLLLTQNLTPYGAKNTLAQVKALQQFLDTTQGEKLPVTGYYGSMTKAAVSRFQTKYKDLILKPLGLTQPTGSVGAATRKVINDLACAGK